MLRTALISLALAAVASASKADDLQAELQTFLDSVVAPHPGLTLSLGWHSDTLEFGLAAGQVNNTDNTASRPATPKDTFLYGSGTKPFTAAAVLRLVEEGKVNLDDPVSMHVDPVLKKDGTSWAELFGTEGAAVTVGLMLQMRSGIKDYDGNQFDDLLLYNQSSAMTSPVAFIKYVAAMDNSFDFTPGTMVSYSSTNFVTAGLILINHGTAPISASTWETMKTDTFFPADVVTKDLADSFFFTTETISDHLTAPGYDGGDWRCDGDIGPAPGYTCSNSPNNRGWYMAPITPIFAQKSPLLGFTCANLVGTTIDVARWYWDLLVPKTVVNATTVKTMEEFRVLNFGWAVDAFQYGTGLMLGTQSQHYLTDFPPQWGKWGSYVGHGGSVYGFNSVQGVFYGLNASLSIVTNSALINPNSGVACSVVEIAARVMLGETISLGCPSSSMTTVTETAETIRRLRGEKGEKGESGDAKMGGSMQGARRLAHPMLPAALARV